MCSYMKRKPNSRYIGIQSIEFSDPCNIRSISLGKPHCGIFCGVFLHAIIVRPFTMYVKLVDTTGTFCMLLIWLYRPM